MFKWIIRRKRVRIVRRRRARKPRKQSKKTKEELAKYREAARELALRRLEYFNQFYGFKWNRIFIKAQVSRWGSCSAKGNINFNYKIALLPLKLSDYIIVHELCHLGEFNHSEKFWDLVARTVPDWKKCRAELRRNEKFYIENVVSAS